MGTDYHYLYIGTYTSIEAQGCRREDACGREIYLFERQEDGGFDKYQNRTEEEMDQDIYPAYNPSYLAMDRILINHATGDVYCEEDAKVPV